MHPPVNDATWRMSGMVTIDCQSDRITNHLGERPPATSVRDFLDRVSCGGEIQPKCGHRHDMEWGPRLNRRGKVTHVFLTVGAV